MKASVKVFYNTCALYIKMGITIVIGLYLTRVVLNELGVEDYGIYNLIGGVIALLSFLQTALSVSTQRFLSVTMGRQSRDEVKYIFKSSLAIHIVLSLFVVIILEICSLFIFDGFLNIPIDRINAAKDVFQIMILSTFFTILQVPYSADITANEDLWFFSIVETFTTFVKLYIIFLFRECTMDKLILYSYWMKFAIILGFIIKLVWCKKVYDECKGLNILRYTKKKCVKEMIGFTGWNSFGTLSLVGRNQGVAILLNVFWGPAINAVYGIANQVNGQLIHFSQIMTSSLAPQIMKSEGEGNRGRMLFLAVFASKMAFFLSAVLALPLIVEIDVILGVWLKNVPEYTELYCILILLMFLVMQLYPGLTRAIQATGIIKQYQIITSFFFFLPIPIGYVLYQMGMHNATILYLMVISQILQMVYAIYYSTSNIGLNAFKCYFYIIKASVCFVGVGALGYTIRYYLSSLLRDSFTFSIVVSSVVLLFSLLYYIIVLDKKEKESIRGIVYALLNGKK